MIGVRVKGITACPQGTSRGLAMGDIAVAGEDIHEYGNVVDPEIALRHRIVLAGSDNVLNIRHLVHDVKVGIIPRGVHRVIVKGDLVHRPVGIDAGIVVGDALRDQHGALPVGLVAVDGDGLALTVAVVGVGGIVTADRIGGAAVGSGTRGGSLLISTALGNSAVGVGRADVELDGFALRDIRAEGQVDRTVDHCLRTAVDGVVGGISVGDGDGHIDGALKAAALVGNADHRDRIGAVIAPGSCGVVIELVSAGVSEIVGLTVAVKDDHVELVRGNGVLIHIGLTADLGHRDARPRMVVFLRALLPHVAVGYKARAAIDLIACQSGHVDDRDGDHRNHHQNCQNDCE